MQYSGIVLIALLVTACTSDSIGPAQEKATIAPMLAGDKAVVEPKQSYGDCMNYCEGAMDQAGQVTDECPQSCKEDSGAYTQDDLMSDDENLGLIVSERCLIACLKTSVNAKPHASCKQNCCVDSCERRQDYNGSGMGPECPGMCRDFLKRTAQKQ